MSAAPQEPEVCKLCSGWRGLPGYHDGDCPKRVKERRIDFLEKKFAGVKADLLLKFEDDDFHGVADAAMDLRDIVSELKGLRL